MADYMHGHHGTVVGMHARRTATNSAGFLMPRLRRGTAVLDVGCGPGSVTLDLARLVAPGVVVGVDAAPSALTAARAEATRRRDELTAFAQADATQLPFPDDSFDVVFAHQLLQHLTDPVAALTEMARVCRPGGTVAVRDVDYQSMTWYPEASGLDSWLSVYRRVAGHLGAQPDAGRRLRSWARAAGLDDTDAGASVWCYASPDDCRWWGDSQADRVLQSRFADCAAAAGITAEELGTMSAAWRDWGAHPDAWFTMVHGEILATVH